MLPPNLGVALKNLQASLPNLSPEQREKAAAVLSRLKWTAENEALRLFQPHGGQEEFIRDIEGGFICISGAGNGWGKSEMLAAIFAAVMWPALAPDALKLATFQNWKYPKRARIYSGPAELEEIGSLQTAIGRLFPKGRYEVSKGRYSYPSVFHSDTGWVLDLFSYERDAKEAAGPNIGLQGFNEPPPEPLYKEAIARSRAGGYIIGGFTSLLDNTWVVDGILNKHDGKNIRVRYGSSCENCKQHGVNGNLEHDQIEKVLSQYDPDEREARFTGRPLSMSGRIFKTFNHSVHVAKEEFQPPTEGISLGMVVDPAIGKPFAILWRWVDKTGTVHYYDEYPEVKFQGAKDSNLTVKEYAELIRARENGRQFESRILDRHFGNVRRTTGGLTLKQEFDEQKLEFTDSYAMAGDEVETGILKVKDYLRYDTTKPIDAVNRPRIVISPKCKNLIAAFQSWGRDPKTLKPKEDYKDFMDLVRYDLMSNPEVDPGSTWKSGSKPYYGVQS